MRESIPMNEPEPGLPAGLSMLDEELDTLHGKEFKVIDDPCLAEVDHLCRFMKEDGTWPDDVLEALQVNLLTAVKEAAMPYAVSTTHQEYKDGTFMWLDQTPVQVAESGYRFHRHPNAIKRVDIEVAEAKDVEESLRPGRIKVFISPKMSRSDAPYEEAKREHLGDDDMIRIHMLNSDEQGVQGKFMQSVLVRDIPLEAWVKMFEDDANIFGKSFVLRDKSSALSIMELHKELELPESALPEGAISLIEAVVPYLSAEDRRKVESQLLLFRGDQEQIHRKAELIAARWLSFEIELAKSVRQGKATTEVQRFVFGLQHEWGEEALNLLEELRLQDGGFMVTRGLAAKIEKAKQQTLWVSAAVITDNKKVISQLDITTAQRIYDNEMLIQQMMHEGAAFRDIIALEVQNNQIVARQEVRVGGGCAGDGEADFSSSKSSSKDSTENSGSESAVSMPAATDEKQEKKHWKWKSGVCRITRCPTRPRTTKVGPCEVCTCCQQIFDRGGDPAAVYSGKVERAEVEEVPEAEAPEEKTATIGRLVLVNA